MIEDKPVLGIFTAFLKYVLLIFFFQYEENVYVRIIKTHFPKKKISCMAAVTSSENFSLCGS